MISFIGWTDGDRALPPPLVRSMSMEAVCAIHDRKVARCKSRSQIKRSSGSGSAHRYLDDRANGATGQQIFCRPPLSLDVLCFCVVYPLFLCSVFRCWTTTLLCFWLTDPKRRSDDGRSLKFYILELQAETDDQAAQGYADADGASGAAAAMIALQWTVKWLLLRNSTIVVVREIFNFRLLIAPCTTPQDDCTFDQWPLPKPLKLYILEHQAKTDDQATQANVDADGASGAATAISEELCSG